MFNKLPNIFDINRFLDLETNRLQQIQKQDKHFNFLKKHAVQCPLIVTYFLLNYSIHKT